MSRAIDQLTNNMRQQAELSGRAVAKPRSGEITSYDPVKHAVKVTLQPEGEEVAGWIPLGAVGIGNGFGVLSAPNIGEMVQVTFSEGDIKAPRITGRFFSNVNMPPVVPAGETWVVHKSGSYLKFHNDGTVEINVEMVAKYTAQQHHFIGPVLMDNTLTGLQGMAISGDNGTGNASSVSGNTNFVGQVSANGHRIDDSHKHVNSGGSGLGGVPQ